MARFVAFARGINVGGKNKLKMARLVELFERAGAREVATYIQSGNVLFSCGTKSEASAQVVADAVTTLLKKEDGLTVPLTVRPKAHLARVQRSHPFATAEEDKRMVSVGFLSGAPTRQAIQGLDQERSPGDRFLVQGREIYLHTPNGSARSKLTVDFFDRGLCVVTTVRNLKTVCALVELE
jgi:uncharacterized protein (DUF1697 family)